ncbi:hypothetical protein FRB99_007842 [Tulasnella sp. 403]|nr:hypothetical protein FRB99_007842 [Tulasnella sp. 403]
MAAFTQQPVKFDDDDPPSYSGPIPRSTGTPSALSMPGLSRPVSGITAEDPFAALDEHGHTRAQSVAQQYRASVGSSKDIIDDDDDIDRSRSRDTSPGRQRSEYHDESVYPYGGTNASTDAMTYIDENFNSYSNRRQKPEGVTPDGQTTSRSFQDLEYADPYEPPQPSPRTQKSRFNNLLGASDNAKFPIDQQIEAKRRGALVKQSRPYLTWALTVVMTGILIYELIANANAQGTPFSMRPFVNPLLGPNQAVLIQVGARFAPCMKDVEQVPLTMELGCPDNVNNPPTSLCTIEQLCAHGGFNGGEPNQWWRFITPVFLHAGIVHLLVNMFVQCTVGAQVEREMGSIGFAILYFSAGIFGNVLGGNFAMVGLPSVGASGAIFGTVGALWVDLIAHWRFEHRPVTKLIMLIVELIFGIALGFLPGTDNFAHIGGFILGLLSAIALYPVITETKQRTTLLWALRLLAVAVGIILFVVLIRNFYTANPYAGKFRVLGAVISLASRLGLTITVREPVLLKPPQAYRWS